MNACLWTLYSLLLTASVALADGKPVFRFHSALDIATVDPAALIESSGGYIFFNLYRSLYRLGEGNTPTLDLAESCTWQNTEKTEFHCRLRPSKFSNGKPITAAHFVWAWQRLVDPKTGSRHSELLLPLKNAMSIIEGKKPLESLGVRATSERDLVLSLEQPDTDLAFRLSSPILTPLWTTPVTDPAQFTKAVTSGPYQIQSWEKKSHLRLINNPHYWDQAERPEVDVVIVEDDTTALGLYDLGKLDFLRRLNVKEMPLRQTQKDFIFHPLVRFDYVGFGPALQEEPELRRALSLSLNYSEVTTLLKTPGKVGCPTLAKSLASPWPCLKFDLVAAKAAWKKVSAQQRSRKLTLLYSSTAGEDVARSMEWMQAQWKKNLNTHVELRPLETKVVLSELKISPTSLYRKGVTLDRPTCAAAMELFTTGNSENYLGLKSVALDGLVKQMLKTEDPRRLKDQCGQGLNILINGNHLIPLGEMYFAMLAKPTFTGWRLTSLNQLDLTHLRSNIKSD